MGKTPDVSVKDIASSNGLPEYIVLRAINVDRVMSEINNADYAKLYVRTFGEYEHLCLLLA